MAKLSSFLTEDNIKTILSVAVKVAEGFKDRSANWKNKTLPTMIGSIAAIAAMLGFLIYFIVTHRIGPLMIYTACAIPILAFCLTLFSKNLDKIQKEFTEYTEAMKQVFSCIKNSCDLSQDEAVAAIGTVIVATAGIEKDQLSSMAFAEIEALPQYQKACVYAQSIKNFQSAIAALKEEGSDVDELLASLDLDDYQTDELYQEKGSNMYENLTGTGDSDESSSGS